MREVDEVEARHGGDNVDLHKPPPETILDHLREIYDAVKFLQGQVQIFEKTLGEYGQNNDILADRVTRSEERQAEIKQLCVIVKEIDDRVGLIELWRAGVITKLGMVGVFSGAVAATVANVLVRWAITGVIP